MGTKEKLVEKLRRKPPEAEFSDIERLLEAFGHYRAGGDGSHFVFRGADGRKVTVPTVKGRKVKRQYIVRVLQFLGIDLEDSDER